MLSKLKKSFLGQFIPIINIQGQITNTLTDRIYKKLDCINLTNSVALAVTITSSDGYPVQSQILSNKLRQFSRQNNLKLLTFGRQIVTSTSYIILAAGDQVYCDKGTLIGNLSVSIPKYDLKKFGEQFGVESKRIHSNDDLFGAKLTPFHELTQIQQQKVKQVCKSLNKQFISQIKTLRGIKINKQQQKIFNGEVFTSKQAHQFGLVDGVGSMIEILQQKYPKCKLGVEKEMSVVNTLLKYL